MSESTLPPTPPEKKKDRKMSGVEIASIITALISMGYVPTKQLTYDKPICEALEHQ